MPNFVYRFSNLRIMFFCVLTLSVTMICVPKLLHLFAFFEPTLDSTEIGKSLFSPFASSMGLLIGFLLNQAQNKYAETDNIVSAEAGRVNNLDRYLLRFGSPEALVIRAQLHQYIVSIIEEEWHDLIKSQGNKNTHLLWRSISQKLFKLEPSTPKQTAMYADILKKAEEVSESRELRINRSSSKLPMIFWVVIAAGLTGLVLINSLFIPTTHFAVGLVILPIILGGLISLLIITDQPFKGQTSVKPNAFIKVLDSIKSRSE